MINGKTIIISDAEEVEILAEWTANTALHVLQEKVAANSNIRAQMQEADMKSIDLMREYIVSKADAPVQLKALEAEVIAARAQLQRSTI